MARRSARPGRPPPRAAGAPSRPAGRDRRPPDRRRRRPRRRRVALRRRRVERDRLRRSSARPRTRSGPGDVAATAPTTSCPTPRQPTSTTPPGGTLAPEETHAPARQRARLLQLVPHHGRRSPSGSATSTRPARRSSSRSVDRRLRRGLGRTASCRSRSADRAASVAGGLQRPEPRRPHPDAAAGRAVLRSPSSASTARSRRRRATTSGCARPRSTSTPPSARVVTEDVPLDVERTSAARRGSSRPTPASSGSPAASSSPRARSGRATARCSSARRTRTRSTAGRPRAQVTVFRPKSGYAGVDIGRYHQPGLERAHLRPRGPARRSASTATAA